MIDEEKLIEDFRKCYRTFSDKEMEESDLLMAFKSICSIINRQPKVGGWIPCSKKLPEAEKFYIVTYRFGDETFLKCHELYYGTADGRTEPGWYLGDDYEELYKPFIVIAWQLLPEPYTGQGWKKF